MDLDIAQRCRSLLEELGLAESAETASVAVLTGGVSSDIARVDIGGRSYCVKFALEKLKVDDDWRAPPDRNRAEYAWLEFASKIAPQSVPRLYGRSEEAGGFAMELVTGADVYLWKQALLDGMLQPHEPIAVASLVGRIHAASAVPSFDKSPFRNRDDFYALRIEPYLIHTAKRHPSIQPQLSSLAEALYAADDVLVHGDVSPKNILFRGTTPLLLDAECATMGDACFDVAFCLNHLVLKAVHRPRKSVEFFDGARSFWKTYAGHVLWEEAELLERRTAALLPALMLARVDGKSPVEYLSEKDRDLVRSMAVPLIRRPPESLSEALATVAKELTPGGIVQ